MKKKMLLFLLMLSLISAIFSVTIHAQTYSYGYYEYEIVNDCVIITDCDDSVNGFLKIPSEIDGLPVISIARSAFAFCDDVTMVSIPESVTLIGINAFYGCSNLETVTFFGEVLYIGDYAFFGCVALKDIEFPESLMHIGDFAFCNCNTLSSITIPVNVSNIGDCAFYGCSNLAQISLPNTNIHIGDNAFGNTSYFATASNWENELLYINNHLICADKSIAACKIRKGTLTVADAAFYACTALTDVVIPNSLVQIGKYAFDNCTNLKELTIPSNVSSIGWGAFDNCSALSVIYFGGTRGQWAKALLGETPSATVHYGFYITDLIINDMSDYGISIYTTEIIGRNLPDSSVVWIVSYDKEGKVLETKALNPDNLKTTLNTSNVYKIKAFAWESIENMTPLCNSFEKVVN